MPCTRLMTAYRTSDGSVVWNQLSRHDIVAQLAIPCGQCPGCRLERARQWSMRVINEASLYKDNAWVTLTYAPENLPPLGQLHYPHFQRFMRYLRRQQNKTVRFYMCGEYGENFSRPHYHACLFNVSFSDLKLQCMSNGLPLFNSSTLSKLWPHGHSLIGELNKQTAGYTARYVMKKVLGFNSRDYYRATDPETGLEYQRIPEFTRMSLKPGIGAAWFNKFKADVYPHDAHIHDGTKCRPPKYYDKLLERSDPDMLEELQMRRLAEGRSRHADNTDARLATKEEHQILRLTKLQRTLENETHDLRSNRPGKSGVVNTDLHQLRTSRSSRFLR